MARRQTRLQLGILPGTDALDAVTKGQLDTGVADAKARANHTGSQPSSTISDFVSAVDARVQTLVGAAPAALDTLTELAAALGNDANYAATMTGLINALDARLDALEAAGTAKRTASVLIGNGVASTFNVDHNWNLGDKNKVMVEIVDTTTGDTGDGGVTRSTANRVVVDFGGFVPANGQYRVLLFETA